MWVMSEEFLFSERLKQFLKSPLFAFRGKTDEYGNEEFR